MTSLSNFLKQNKSARKNIKYVASKEFCDEDGLAIEWELRSLTTKDDERIREECTTWIPSKKNPNVTFPKMNTKEYISKMLVNSVVYPDLHNAELQDSYGVKTTEDLLYELIDNPGEYADFGAFVQNLNGFNISFDEKVQEGKN